MEPNVSPLERAFVLARSGRFASIGEIKLRLQFEGYSIAQVTGPQLNAQLQACIDEARKLPLCKPRQRLKERVGIPSGTGGARHWDRKSRATEVAFKRLSD
jgi:hypothetical protein